MNENRALSEGATVKRKTRRKPAVYEEQVKTAHTTHWDWDYLHREEIDQLFRDRAREEHTERAHVAMRLRRTALAIGLIFTSLLWVSIDLDIA